MGQKGEFLRPRIEKKEQRFLPKVLPEILTLEFYEKKNWFRFRRYCFIML
jgi:hypothetical protein